MSSNLDEFAFEIQNSGANFKFVSRTSAQLGDLKDEEIVRVDALLKLPNYELTQYKNIMERFLVFYSTGKVEQGDSAMNAIFDMINIGRAKTVELWDSTHRSSETVYKKSEVYPIDLDIDMSSFEATYSYASGSSTEAMREYFESFTDNSQSEFCACVKQRMNGMTTVSGLSDDSHLLLQSMSFLALTFLRTIVKTDVQLRDGFAKKRYVQNFRTIGGWGGDRVYHPPCKKACGIAVLEINRENVSATKLFTKVVAAFVQEMRVPTITTGGSREMFPVTGSQTVRPRCSFLSSTVLTHTSRNGLGFINMVQAASIACNVSWDEIANISLFSTTKASWKAMLRFTLEYNDSNNAQYGYNWARVINDGYLREFSAKENLFTCAILAGIIEQSTGTGIWEAQWCAGNRAALEKWGAVGRAVFDALYKDPLETEASSRTRAIVERAERAGMMSSSRIIVDVAPPASAWSIDPSSKAGPSGNVAREI